MNKAPRLFLTSMSSESSAENCVEMIESLLPWLDGVTWALCDTPKEAPSARYLESVKGLGKVIYRPWPPGRHSVPMNDVLWCGGMNHGDFYIWSDALERPKPDFVSKIKTNIIPMMNESDCDVISYFGKAFLVRFNESLEYFGSPHWSLKNHNGRGIEWNQIEPNETKVRENVRPKKRTDPLNWIFHYQKYWFYPPGSNHAALGLEAYAKGHGINDLNRAFRQRETQRLQFREFLRSRGVPLTLDGFKAFLLNNPLDEETKKHLNAEKTLSDYYNYLIGRGNQLKDTHNPADALPIL